MLYIQIRFHCLHGELNASNSVCKHVKLRNAVTQIWSNLCEIMSLSHSWGVFSYFLSLIVKQTGENYCWTQTLSCWNVNDIQLTFKKRLELMSKQDLWHWFNFHFGTIFQPKNTSWQPFSVKTFARLEDTDVCDVTHVTAGNICAYITCAYYPLGLYH